MRRWLLALCLLYAPWTAGAVLRPRPTFRQALARLTAAMAGLPLAMTGFNAALVQASKAMAVLAAATPRRR